MSQLSATPARSGDLPQYIQRVITLAPPETLRALLEPYDEWVVSLETAHLLACLVEHIQPRSILEFGAGRSSLVLASALERCGRGQLTSIEHQPAYAEPAWRRMVEFPAVDARLEHAGLATRFSKHGLLHEYVGIHGALAERGPFDFVFIDAPPGNLGRDATLLAAAPFLTAGAIVLLDDARRPGEKTAVRRWMRGLDVETVFESDTVGRGVVVLRVRRPRPAAFSWRTFTGTVHDRIVEARWRVRTQA